MDTRVRAAIAAIGEEAWTPACYPKAIWDEDQRRWISDAGVAEVPYTAFTSKKGQEITARLIVRRVRDLNRAAADGQDELFACWRYHAVFTDSPFETIQAEAQHRDHAIIEQVFADLTSGPLAHLPLLILSSIGDHGCDLWFYDADSVVDATAGRCVTRWRSGSGSVRAGRVAVGRCGPEDAGGALFAQGC
jgi:hypothetical protein